MKTSLKTLTAITLTAIVLATTGFNSSAALKIITLEKSTANAEVKKVIVTGNTKVLLIQSSREYVSMEDDMIEKVNIKQEGNTLFINSTETEPVTVTVYVKSPFRIKLSDQAEVRTVGKFNLKYLQVMVADDARAKIKVIAEDLYTVVNDNAILELLGTAGNHTSSYAGAGKLKMDKFAALKTNQEIPDMDLAAAINRKTAVQKLQNNSLMKDKN